MRSKRWIALWVLALFGLALQAPAVATEAEPETYPLYWYVDPDGEGGVEVGEEVGSATITSRDEDEGISFVISTTGLEPGHGYTVWFFSYDFPENCTTGDGTPGNRCTGYDLLTPGTFASIMWGNAGGLVEVEGNEAGDATFEGRRPANSSLCLTEPVNGSHPLDGNCAGVLAGHGLHNPMGAEIHFVLRDHGPAQDGLEEEQISTINGGCDPLTHEGLPVFGVGWGSPGDYPCFDPQGNN